MKSKKQIRRQNNKSKKIRQKKIKGGTYHPWESF